MAAFLRVQLLADFRLIDRDGLPMSLNTPRLQSLLAYLILHRDAPQSRQHLAFLLWPDSAEAQARTNLRKALHELRQALPEADHLLAINNLTIRWCPTPTCQADVVDFEAALAADDLLTAIDVYRGDLLPGCYDDWIMPERERLRQKYMDALEQAVRQAETRGDLRAAVGYAQRLLRDDAVREATYRDLMRLYMTLNDRAGALRVYHACETTLRRELDVEPSAATRELYQQLLNAGAPPIRMPQALAANPPLIGRAAHDLVCSSEILRPAAPDRREWHVVF